MHRRQFLARIPPSLFERARERAVERHISLNQLVLEALEHAIGPRLAAESPVEALRRRGVRLGLVAPPTAPAPDAAERRAAIAATGGAGTAVSEALEAERGPR